MPCKSWSVSKACCAWVSHSLDMGIINESFVAIPVSLHAVTPVLLHPSLTISNSNTSKHHQSIAQKVTGRIKRPVNAALIKNKCWESNISPRYQPRCLGWTSSSLLSSKRKSGVPICHCPRHQILANRWRPNADRNSQIWLKTTNPLCNKHTKQLTLQNTKPNTH